MSGVILLLFLRGIQRISGVIPAKSSPGKDKPERSLLSLTIYIYVSFKLFPEIDLDLSTVLTASVLRVDLDLYIDLTLSVLLLLGVSTVLFDGCDFSVFFTVSIFFFD